MHGDKDSGEKPSLVVAYKITNKTVRLNEKLFSNINDLYLSTNFQMLSVNVHKLEENAHYSTSRI